MLINPSASIKKWSNQIVTLLGIEETPLIKNILYAWTECTVLEAEMRRVYDERVSTNYEDAQCYLALANTYCVKRDLLEALLQCSNIINQAKLEALNALTKEVFKDKAEEENK